MARHKKNQNILRYFAKNIFTVIGLVLVWRGVWYIFDSVDVYFFGSYHGWTALGGFIVGLLMLYLPDGDLKEIEKL